MTVIMEDYVAMKCCSHEPNSTTTGIQNHDLVIQSQEN